MRPIRFAALAASFALLVPGAWCQSPCPNWSATIPQDNAQYGRTIANAGDVNGDGYDDLLVGALALGVDITVASNQVLARAGSVEPEPALTARDRAADGGLDPTRPTIHARRKSRGPGLIPPPTDPLSCATGEVGVAEEHGQAADPLRRAQSGRGLQALARHPLPGFLILMVSASLGGPFGACARDEQAPSVPGPSGGSAAMPFVFLSSIEPHAGGRAGTSQVFLLDAEERLQVSSESTDGLLFLLEDARLSQGTFRDVLARSSDLPPASSPARMQDHSPARVAVGRLDPSGTYDMRSFAAREQPAGLAALAEHLRLLREGAQLVRSRPGLYVRAQRIPTFDARVQPPDLVLDDEAARRTPVLAELLKQEMRLVRVGDSGTSVPLGESLEFRSGRAMHVQVGSRVYRLLAYSTVPNPEGEEK